MKSKIHMSTIALILGIGGLIFSCMCIGLPREIETEVIDTQILVETEIEEIAEDTENSETVVETAVHNLNAAVDAIADITIPEYSGNPYVSLNDNIPYFTDEELTTVSFELYSDVDYIGRCRAAYANICKEIMPTEERGEIGSVKPSGWHTVKYDCIDGMFLYNRCHLIGYQLAGENANTKNLITGTRYLSVEGMLPFENMVGDYVNETNNHVLYRVTPVYEENNLVASGVIIEAKSVEDNGDGILFNVYCYNVQPGISIDYLTGESAEVENEAIQYTNEVDNGNEAVQTEEISPESGTIVEPEQAAGQEQAVEQEQATSPEQSDTGEKYHSINNCGRMNPDNARQVTEEYAISSGFEKCSKCW